MTYTLRNRVEELSGLGIFSLRVLALFANEKWIESQNIKRPEKRCMSNNNNNVFGCPYCRPIWFGHFPTPFDHLTIVFWWNAFLLGKKTKIVDNIFSLRYLANVRVSCVCYHLIWAFASLVGSIANALVRVSYRYVIDDRHQKPRIFYDAFWNRKWNLDLVLETLFISCIIIIDRLVCLRRGWAV